MKTIRKMAWRLLGAASPMWMLGLHRRQLRVLAYHGVNDAERFREQASYLADHYSLVTYEEVARSLTGSQLPERPCWVTFDDAEPSVVELGLEILEEFSIPATLFVCPGVVDTAEPLWWQVVEAGANVGLKWQAGIVTTTLIADLKRIDDIERRAKVAEIRDLIQEKTSQPVERRQISTLQLQEWLASGRTIGSHTWDHPLLDLCRAEEQVRQIDEAHRWLVDMFGSAGPFAYPNGNYSVIARERLDALGYQVAALFDHRVDRGGDPMRMSRLRVNSDDPIHQFKARVSGSHSSVSSIRRSRFRKNRLT